MSRHSLSPSRNHHKRVRSRNTDPILSTMDEMETQQGGWNDWAMFIVSETKRFAVDIQKNEDQMLILRESISDLKVTLKGLELIVTRIAENEEEIQKNIVRLSSLERFKSRAIAVSSTVWAILGVAITIMAVFLSRSGPEPDPDSNNTISEIL